MKPTLTFNQAYTRLHKAEGGLSLDPKDPGNWTGGKPGVGLLKGTKFGIAANTYPDLDIINLTEEQAKAIYYRDWWVKAGAEYFHAAIIYQLWDFAVNSGMSNAKRKLQKAAGVADDGNIGPVSIKAIQSKDLNDLLFLFTAEKIEFYASLSTWLTYGKGWMRRTAQNLRYCASDNIDLPPAIVGLPMEKESWEPSLTLPPAPSVGSESSLPQSSASSATESFKSPKDEAKLKESQPSEKPMAWWNVLAKLLPKNPKP